MNGSEGELEYEEITLERVRHTAQYTQYTQKHTKTQREGCSTLNTHTQKHTALHNHEN